MKKSTQNTENGMNGTLAQLLPIQIVFITQKRQKKIISEIHFHSFSDNSKSITDTATPTTSAPHQNVQADKRTDFAKNEVTLGLRSSIRCVSSGKGLALLLSSKIRPKYIVDQIIVMTLTKNANSKVFCVPDLDAALLDVLGFSCQCLAISEGRNELWTWILEKSKQFPLPNSFGKSKTTKVLKTTKVERMDVETPSTVAVESNKIDIATLHLRKETSDERAFIPHGRSMRTDNVNDFIALGAPNLQLDTIRPQHQLISKIQRTNISDAKTRPRLENAFAVKGPIKKKSNKVQNQQFRANKVNYLALKVNRVQPNAEKIRNKNKNKK